MAWRFLSMECAALSAGRRHWALEALGLPPGHFLRSRAVNVAATSRARAKSPGAKEIAETRWWPPPPYCSASVARLASALARFQGLVPSETLARTFEALTLTE